jgi:hypothetical protein
MFRLGPGGLFKRVFAREDLRIVARRDPELGSTTTRELRVIPRRGLAALAGGYAVANARFGVRTDRYKSMLDTFQRLGYEVETDEADGVA